MKPVVLLLIAMAAVCVPAIARAASERSGFSAEGDFSESAVYRGVKATKEQCDAVNYEPTEHLRKDRAHEKLRVFVLGNPDETNVVWPSQVIMAVKLKEAGIPVEILHGKGTGPDGHGLKNSARIVAGWCFHENSTREITRKSVDTLRG